jgi:hypothetical protein
MPRSADPKLAHSGSLFLRSALQLVGSWGLSNDELQGGSTGSYTNSSSDQETLLGSNSTMNQNGQNTSYSRVATGAETDSVYQSGLVQAGVYNNGYYFYSATAGLGIVVFYAAAVVQYGLPCSAVGGTR